MPEVAFLVHSFRINCSPMSSYFELDYFFIQRDLSEPTFHSTIIKGIGKPDKGSRFQGKVLQIIRHFSERFSSKFREFIFSDLLFMQESCPSNDRPQPFRQFSRRVKAQDVSSCFVVIFKIRSHADIMNKRSYFHKLSHFRIQSVNRIKDIKKFKSIPGHIVCMTALDSIHVEKGFQRQRFRRKVFPVLI